MARILIIEDNAANLNLMSYLLTAFGHTVEGCRDSQLGLDAVRRQRPDLVLCDIQLPKLSGYQIAETLRSDPALRELPLVAVSALAMRDDGKKALAAGFTGYIEKPVQPETLVSLVESFLPPALRKGGPRVGAAHTPAAPAPMSAPQQCPQRTVLAVDDVAANLNRLAYSDPLTGLMNRTAFQHRLELAVDNAVTGHYAAGVLMISLGNFREINDTLGPDGGDRVLRETAARMKESADRTDIACTHLGATQYGVLLHRLDSPQHLVRAAHALMTVLAMPITVDGIPVEVAPCIGAAQCPDDALSGDELLRRAGVALHHAIEQHLPYANYSSEQDPFNLQRLTLVSELRRAIAHNQLELWYQPKLDLSSGRVDAVEALIRWRHPERGLISPDEFIPAAERTGLIHSITRWVLTEALQQSKRWRDQGLYLNVAINISLTDLREASFQTQLLRAIQINGLPANSVTLEITESAAMQDPPRVVKTLGELRQHGFRISLDDFGTGQASLAHLHSLPVDEIKLDKSFVMNLPDNRSQSIARATAMLAREFGLKTVAEGMESAGSQQILGQLGYDRVQGYHLSKPLPPAELEAWIAKRNVPPQVAGG